MGNPIPDYSNKPNENNKRERSINDTGINDTGSNPRSDIVYSVGDRSHWPNQRNVSHTGNTPTGIPIYTFNISPIHYQPSGSVNMTQ